MQNSKLLKILLLSFILLIVFMSASYSYFAAQGVGVGLDNQATITVGELKLVYEDGTDSFSTSGEFEPGDFMIKSFNITNESPTTAYYKIYMDDVVNTFIMQKKNEDGSVTPGTPYELIYTLRKNGEEIITESSNTPVLINDGLIYGGEELGIAIESKSTDAYQLMIKFIDTNENQNYNQTKLFRGKISIKEPKTFYEKMLDQATINDDLIVDEFKNIRYVGTNPKNYITFNGEEWRIIGIFKDVGVLDETDFNSELENKDLIKIIRTTSLGEIAWDSRDQNDWTNATLMNILNGDYLDNEGTYTGTSTIKSLAKVSNYIAKVRWNIGGRGWVNNRTAKDYYIDERGTIGSGKNPSAVVWYGKVALMYPSDYGYAAGGACALTSTSLYSGNGCAEKNWLFDEYLGLYQWTLSPFSDSTNAIFKVHGNGDIRNDGARYRYQIRPTLFLRYNIKLLGTGEQQDPFRIIE